jgi:hypothetical protein
MKWISGHVARMRQWEIHAFYSENLKERYVDVGGRII